MQFITNVSDLQDALSTVTRAIAARSAKKILEGVLIDAAEDEITLTCTDSVVVIQCTIQAEIKEPGRIVLPGRLFAEFVRKLPQSEVSMQTFSGNSVQIKCMNTNSRFSGLSALDFPEMADIPKGDFVSIPQNRFKDMINHVVFSTSTDESRIILTGVLIEFEEDAIHMVALDGFRLSMQVDRRKVDLPDHTKKRIVVPGRIMSEISKILADEESPCEMFFDASHIRFMFGNTVVSTSLLMGEYMDYHKIIPTDFTTSAVVNKEALGESIERASLLAREGKTNIVKMQLMDGQINISSKAEQGDVLEFVDAAVEGDPLEIAFNAKYISDVIRNVNDENLTMRFKSNVSPCIITNTENGEEEYLYLILPVRVFN